MDGERKTGKRADWDEWKLRLAAVKEALAGSPQSDQSRLRKEAILAARAKAIAEPAAGAESGERDIDVLEFRLGPETYAIETAQVLEVHAMKDYTPIPCTPAFVLGILNVRGRIFSVLDLRTFFGIPVEGITELNKAILLKGEGMEFGILADSILSVGRLPLSACRPPLPTHTGIRGKYLKCITGKGVIVLDAVKLLSDPSIVVREQVGQEDARGDNPSHPTKSYQEDIP